MVAERGARGAVDNIQHNSHDENESKNEGKNESKGNIQEEPYYNSTYIHSSSARPRVMQVKVANQSVCHA